MVKPTPTNEDIVKKLIQARVKLIMYHPFFGQIALRFRLIEAADWCPTAATDGRDFYYNPEFINKLDIEETVFLIAHEIGHCMFEHMLRRDSRNPQIWNMAGDYVINRILEREICSSGGNKSIARVITSTGILLDRKYDGLTAEQVYDQLIEENAEEQDTLDMHLDMTGGDGNGKKNGDGSNKEGDTPVSGAGKPDPLTPEEQKKLRDEMKEVIMQAAQAAGNDKVPAEIRKMITDLTESKMNWREVLAESIQSSIRTDFAWTRPNRKSQMSGAILPGMVPDEDIELALAIDTSGSISQSMLQDFVSEVAGIMDQYTDYKIHIWQFDTSVYGQDEFTSDDGRDICEYEIKGGGGTDFEVNWKFMKDNDIMPRQLLMFTDGMPWNSWGDPDYCETVFLIHDEYSGSKGIEAPFGRTVHYDSKA